MFHRLLVSAYANETIPHRSSPGAYTRVIELCLTLEICCTCGRHHDTHAVSCPGLHSPRGTRTILYCGTEHEGVSGSDSRHRNLWSKLWLALRSR